MKKFLSTLHRHGFKKRYEMFIISAIVLTGFSIILLLYLSNLQYINRYTRNHWQEHTYTFANTVRYSVVLNSSSIANKMANNYANNPNILNASVYLTDHTLLASSNPSETSCNPEHKEVEYIESKKIWCFYSSIFHNTDYIGYVELVVSKYDLNVFMKKITTLLTIIVLIVFVIFYFVIRKVSSTFIRPLSEIIKVLREVSEGRYESRLSFTGSPDIERMKIILNEMLTKIETNEKILEQTVENRTNELKIALETSKSANQYKNQIITMVSHEMKTPLHSIGNYLELIYETVPNHSDYAIYHDFYNKACIRIHDLDQLINKILIHGKLEVQNVVFSIEKFNVKELIEKTVHKVEELYSKKNNTLVIYGDNSIIESDPNVLGHIISNLLDNAYKYTTNGKVIVSWKRNKDNLVIGVKDTGCGIEETMQSQIFKPFWQADMTLTREHGGHGLGLAIVKQFSELLGGEVVLTSKQNEGSLFKIKIPLQLG